MKTFNLGIETLTIGIIFDILHGKTKIMLSPATVLKVEKSAEFVAGIVKKEKVVYGINTGFGVLCDTVISPQDTAKLQSNLLISHAVGVGNAIPEDMSKIMLILKVHALAKGFSGITMQTLQKIIWHIENDIIPVVPEKGSVGASGDLAPLAHLFLPLLGFGEVFVKGVKHNTAQYFAQNNIKPIVLHAKEGLALINGTQFMASFGIAGLYAMHHLLEQEDIISAMALDSFQGTAKPFDTRLHEIRPFPGNKLVASRMTQILEGSQIMSSHVNCERVQDPYSMRCIPQVHGASRNAWLHGKQMLEMEINSVTDNPIVLNEDEVISGGGFHGQPIAMVLDYLTLAMAEIGNVADRRCYLLLEGKYGLPKFLLNGAGLDSGFMIPQYTTAALVTMNKTLCFPASADSIPTCMGQEDHVSMGSISALKLHSVIENIYYIQAIELLFASQALEFRRPNKSSNIIEQTHKLVRQKVEFKTHDTPLAQDINALTHLVKSFTISALGREFNNNYEEFII